MSLAHVWNFSDIFDRIQTSVFYNYNHDCDNEFCNMFRASQKKVWFGKVAYFVLLISNFIENYEFKYFCDKVYLDIIQAFTALWEIKFEQMVAIWNFKSEDEDGRKYQS